MVRPVMASLYQDIPADVHGELPEEISKFTVISKASPLYVKGVLKEKSIYPIVEGRVVEEELYTCVAVDVSVLSVCGVVRAVVSVAFCIHISNKKGELLTALFALFHARDVIVAPAGNPAALSSAAVYK